jgi:putative hydrolase of the HAD superfamily
MADRNISDNGRYAAARRIYEEEKLRHLVVYDGVESTLAALKGSGYRMAIVTDAHSRSAILRMERTGLLPFFDGVITHDMVNAKKPAPEPFLFALEMMKAGRSEAVFIGDSPRRDIEPCRSLGITTVYARYGDRFTKGRTDIPADFTVDAIDALPGILAGYLRLKNTE